MDPLRVLLDVIQEVLKQAVPDVDGRVYLRRAVPRQVKDVSFLHITLGDEAIETQDQAPPTVRRTRTINITPVVRGDGEESYNKALALREQIIAIMREIQMIPDAEPESPCLIDEINPTGESEVEIIGSGEKYFTGLTLAYEAVYVTEEGSRGEAGPGIPAFNVLGVFRQAVAKWQAKRGGQNLTVTDDVAIQED